jgi:hypothetical protein
VFDAGIQADPGLFPDDPLQDPGDAIKGAVDVRKLTGQSEYGWGFPFFPWEQQRSIFSSFMRLVSNES